MSTKEKTYLSPEQISDLQNGRDEIKNPLNESFSIGLTLLSAFTLTDMTQLYQSDFTFDNNRFDKELASLNNV